MTEPTPDAGISPSGQEPTTATLTTPSVRFFRGAKDWLVQERLAESDAVKQKVGESIAEVLGARHISFLLGAGCSSLVRAGVQSGVPTMPELARECLARSTTSSSATAEKKGSEADLGREVEQGPEGGARLEALPAPESEQRTSQAATKDGAGSSAKGLDAIDVTFLKVAVGLDVAQPPYNANLERLLEVLYAQRFAWRATRRETDETFEKLEAVIDRVARFLVAQCLTEKLCAADSEVLGIYRRFYRKLVYRDRSLPRPWVFTTNYDLLSETALDQLGIHHCNGFSGFVERRFDPASFRLSLGEQLDVTTRRWSTVDNFIYLCKLHGSVNWSQSDGPIGIREVQRPRVEEAGNMMIYPSPLKHHATLATPYSDLFREFQNQLVREQSVLVTLGYSFSDEHVNAIIYQALSIPTFRLVIFADPNADGVRPLRELDDPRIWIIGGPSTDGTGKSHYFEHVVDSYLPELPGERIDKAVERVARFFRSVLSPPRGISKPEAEAGSAK